MKKILSLNVDIHRDITMNRFIEDFFNLYYKLLRTKISNEKIVQDLELYIEELQKLFINKFEQTNAESINKTL